MPSMLISLMGCQVITTAPGGTGGTDVSGRTGQREKEAASGRRGSLTAGSCCSCSAGEQVDGDWPTDTDGNQIGMKAGNKTSCKDKKKWKEISQ
jgi:hypothetical protein